MESSSQQQRHKDSSAPTSIPFHTWLRYPASDPPRAFPGSVVNSALKEKSENSNRCKYLTAICHSSQSMLFSRNLKGTQKLGTMKLHRTVRGDITAERLGFDGRTHEYEAMVWSLCVRTPVSELFLALAQKLSSDLFHSTEFAMAVPKLRRPFIRNNPSNTPTPPAPAIECCEARLSLRDFLEFVRP